MESSGRERLLKYIFFQRKKVILLHPDIGREYVNVYFDRFEKNMGDAASGGMNYFFRMNCLILLK